MKFMILQSLGENGVQKLLEFLRKYSTFRTRGGKGAELINFHDLMKLHDFMEIYGV